MIRPTGRLALAGALGFMLAYTARTALLAMGVAL